MKNNNQLIDVTEASKIILDSTEDFGIERIDFLKSEGRILKEDIVADRDFPPFDRVSMDGIAIKVDSFNEGNRNFEIEGIQPAGSKQLTLEGNNTCIEAMTGAILPKNAEAVIPYELVEQKNGYFEVQTNDLKFFQNIHRKGLDRKESDILIPKNTVISSAEIGVLATVGKTDVKVTKLPRIMIISTGDELVEVDKTPQDYQIRRSNVYSLVSLLKRFNISADSIHISDNKVLLKQKINDILTNYDVLIFSGAVSKGKFDFLPEILEELNVTKSFHRVRQRPGKPFWFGKKGNKTVFAFPGNPVSTYVSCLKYFYPWYQKSNSINYTNQNFAILANNFTFNPDLTYFLQVKISNENGCVYAIPVTGNGSGDLANLVDADGFLELPTGQTKFQKGEVFPLITFR